MPRLLIVERLYYFTFAGREGFCLLRIYQDRDHDELRTVMLSEVAGNPGPSVTNCFEHLATGIAKQYGLIAGHTVFIDHYPAHQSFARVHMLWTGRDFQPGEWQRLNDTEVVFYLPREVWDWKQKTVPV